MPNQPTDITSLKFQDFEAQLRAQGFDAVLQREYRPLRGYRYPRTCVRSQSLGRARRNVAYRGGPHSAYPRRRDIRTRAQYTAL